MPYENVMNDVRACVKMQKPSRVPFFACSEEFDVKTCPEITYEQYCQSADLMVSVQKKVMADYDYDWAWLQVDDCIEFEPLGVGVKGQGNILRATCEYLPGLRRWTSSRRRIRTGTAACRRFSMHCVACARSTATARASAAGSLLPSAALHCCSAYRKP